MRIINSNYIRNFFSAAFVGVFLFSSLYPYSAQAAADYGVGRVRTCSVSSGQIDDPLDFDPTSGGKDVEFVMSNPVCISVIAYAYVLVKTHIAYMNSACQNATPFRYAPSPILDAYDVTKSTVKAIVNRDSKCAYGVAAASLSLSNALAMLGAIYLVARDVYEETRICGANWMSPNKKQYINNMPDYKAQLESLIQSYIDSGQTEMLNLDNKNYREWYYGGIEFADYTDGEGYCPDVTLPSSGGSYPRQKYYMKGLETANFNCKKYLIPNGGGLNFKDPLTGKPFSVKRIREYQSAYDCCKKRAREYACIEYGPLHKFCRAGQKCSFYNGSHNDEIGGVAGGGVKTHPVTFQVISQDNGRLACAESYSLCPYNFAVGGGSAECVFYQDGMQNSYGTYTMITPEDIQNGNCESKSEIRNKDCTYNNRAGRCKNYCQYMTHCTKTDLSNYKYVTDITSPYFSNACLDFTGDSRNMMSYGTDFIAGSARHFSAPMAQCIKETMENVFYDRAGHTKCYVVDEYPTEDGECPSGTAYKKGERVSKQSFFSRLQQLLDMVVKLTLTLSIVFFGTKLLFTGKEGVPKKDLLLYIVKLGLVLYFATGDAWQTTFFDGVYSASTVLSQMVFKIQVANDPAKRDGCQFGDISLEDGTQLLTQNPYPYGKEYLAIWDTLDCKIARYLGFGPEVSVANITLLMLAGFFTGPIGIYFAIALMFFGLTLIAATLRALHIFLSSAIAIILMVYISPLAMCCGLFSRTAGIFKSWASNLISFCMQPMILFAYLAIFITIMDKTLIGSATFYGPAPTKTLNCREYCANAEGNMVSSQQSPNCARLGEHMVRPKVDSIACMVSHNGFANWPGLELFGIGIPFLVDFFADHTRERILTIAKAALVMYFLCKFMDEITGIATSLLGGSGLGGNAASGVDFFKSAAGFLGAAQQRANRALSKWGIKGAKGGYKGIKGMVRKDGDKGKKVDKDSGDKGSDNAAPPAAAPAADAAGESKSGDDKAAS